MGVKICIAIAVSNPEKLDRLPGAITAAHSLIEWAEATKEYRTVLITDERKNGKDNPVTIDRLRLEIEPLLGSREDALDRIMIGFAGHGLYNGTRDLWLLSEWDTQPDEVVDVELMRRVLQSYHPKQLTIISDACRSPPSPENLQITGSRVFARSPLGPFETDLDLLLAAGLGQPAYMVRGKQDQKPYCLFTHVVTNSLWGRYPDSLDKIRPGLVTSQSLKAAIRKELPAAANALNQTQNAEIATGFSPPDDVYMAVAAPAAGAVQELELEPPARPRSNVLDLRGLDALSRGAGLASSDFKRFDLGPSIDLGRVGIDLGGAKNVIQDVSRSVAEFRQDLARSITDRLGAEEPLRPTHFESRTGVATIHGHIAQVAVGPSAQAWLDQSPQAPPDSRGRWWGLSGPPGSLAVHVQESGDWVAAALYPGMIGTLSLDDVGATALVYRPGDDSLPPTAAAAAEAAIGAMHAGSLAGAAARDLAARIRQWKHADPVLGVISCYLYGRLNDVGSIHRVAWFYLENQQPVPFDIALLGGLKMERIGDQLIARVPATKARKALSGLEGQFEFTTSATSERSGPVAGGFPWMRQGWDLLDDFDQEVFAPLHELAKGLKPALFTTLRPAEGAAFAKLIREGRV